MKKRKYAGFWIRFAAALVDSVFSVALFGVGWVINIYLTGREGYSVGKRLFGLKVVGMKGEAPIGLTDALLREVIGKIVSGILIGIGFLWIGFDSEKQGLHDKIAKTYVVYNK